MSEYEVIWHGERGNYLCAEGPSTSTAARCAELGDDPPRAPKQSLLPKPGRGYRPDGVRLRDTLLGLLPPASGEPIGLASICVRMEITSEREMSQIAKQLKILTDLGLATRVKVKPDNLAPKWMYRKA